MIVLKKATYLVLLCITGMSLSACKKKSITPFDNDPIATRTLRYLTQSTWKETKIEYMTAAGAWISMPISASDLALSYVFNTNGTYTVYTAANTVNGTGTWVIIGDNTQLALNLNITYDFNILNDTAMQLGLTAQIPYTDASGSVTTYYGMRESFAH